MKKIIIMILILNTIFLTGCWDMREINEIGIVSAVGIDKAEDSNNFILTIQIANPKPAASTSEKPQAAEPFWVLTGEGKTIFDAIRVLSLASSKRIMWAHNYIVIIGESLAKYNIAPVIDYFTHNPELRMKTVVVVSEGNAKEYVASKAGMEDLGGSSLATMYDYAKLTAEYVDGDMLQLSQEYFSEYKQPVLSTISFQEERIKPSDEKPENPTETIMIGGSAIFKKGEMVAMLSSEETRGFAWVFNTTQNTLVTVSEPDQENASLSVETTGVKSKITTKIKDGIPFVTIKVTGSGSIVEEDGATNLPMDEFKEKVAELVEDKIVDDINSCLNKVQKQNKVDSFNFASIIHAQHNKEWDSLIGDKWESIYPDMSIEVSADIKIISSTLNQIPATEIKKKGEKNSESANK